MASDYEIALALHRELNPENSTPPTKKLKKSPTKKESVIVDSEWEVNDPNPDVHVLFQTFDKKYFWGKLESVEVKWSNRMYSCAGICSYKGKWGGCLISLSLPLLKLRPRKDLVETLLHEMIHAYLFVTDRNREREEHGPKFHEHMHRINKEAGTKITVYHSFHDEVKHYKTHWWQCNGPCKDWKPFFGLVKRSMNRAPGPSDFWYNDHKAKCNGEFIKIKEPENFKPRKRKENKTLEKSKGTSSQLTNYFPKNSNSSTNLPKTNTNKTIVHPKNCESGNVFSFSDSLMKDKAITGNNSKAGGGLLSNKGGTLVLNPKLQSASTIQNMNNKGEKLTASANDCIPFSGTGYVLAPPGTVSDRSKSRLLNLASTSSSSSACIITAGNSQNSQHIEESQSTVIILDSDSDNGNISENNTMVHCPVCNKKMPEAVINDHLDLCIGTDIFDIDGNSPSSSRTSN